MRGNERAARSSARAIAAGAFLLAAFTGCKQPSTGAPSSSGQAVGGDRLEITAARVDGTGHVVATLRITRGGVPVATAAEVAALQPAFTLAALGVHPVDGLAAWESLLLTGAQTIPSLPPGGPGTPLTAVLTNVRQPGAESTGALAGADGTFTYTYANAIPVGLDPARTLRAGAWLPGATTTDGTATFDFRPDGGTAAPRDVALHERCRTCHEAVRSPHGAGVGVKICTTCHTWQNADPDTADPAAQYPASRSVDPNPLDLGRLIHRLHRGKELPTLYASTSTAPAPPLAAGSTFPLPFEPWHGGVPPRNAAIVGRKYSVVGADGAERIFGWVLNDYPTDPTLAPRAVPSGGAFPRDLRDCGVCHEGAPQGSEVIYAISRRTCSGCHPEAWFDSAPITDAAKLAHPGGPQADDTRCRGCHVAATATQPKVYAPIAEIHVAPYNAAQYDRPVLELVSVDNMKPDTAPTIRFRLSDRVGPIVPSPGAPSQATETGPFASPTPRKMTFLAITLSGPTVPGYGGYPVTSGDAGNPSVLALVADANGVYTYQFASKLPATASGTWTVGMDGRRRYGVGAGTPLPYYDALNDVFPWPFTGEIFATTESPANPIAYVDTATGSWTPAAPGAAVPRRKVVAQEKCERCHQRIYGHGGLRNRPEYCIICHTANRTDWSQRQPAAGQNVNLAATFDGIEERTIEFKVMVHRIHTGTHQGAASLEAIEPLVIYGVGKAPFWFGEGSFPGNLKNCTTCHEGQSYRLDVMPANAPPTIANETGTIMHQGTRDHVPGEPTMGPMHAACAGCHANGFTETHTALHTLGGVEQCTSCHATGTTSVDVVHGLAAPGATLVSATFSSIAQNILEPRCASAACHGGSSPAVFPRLDAEGAYDAIVGVGSQQASGVMLVKPFDPAASYLLLKLRGEAGSVGGLATVMPLGDVALDPSDLAAIEAWIANGAPHD